MRNYRAYFLDFDGTLFDTLDSLVGVYRSGFQAIGRDCTKEQVAVYMHMSLAQTCDYLHIADEEQRSRFTLQIQEALDYPEFIAQIKIYDDVIPTLHRLEERGKSIAIVSGNTERHIGLVLERFNLSHRFSFIVGSSPTRRSKPSADPILFAMKHLPSVCFSDVVYIGDSLQDPQTAIAGGVDGILLERNKEYPNYHGQKIATLLELAK